MSSLEEVETVTRGQAYLNSLAGRRVTVVGLAKSGVAAARLLRTAGADVTGLDAKPVAALGREAAGLADLDVRLIGGLYVVEALSVIIQVVSFKLTGRRVFRMAPLHHHYELSGWSEPKIVVRFWIVSFALALLALTTLKLR